MNRTSLSFLLLSALIALANCGCYDNWSRCTPQTAFWTGIFWKDCPDYCRRCKNKDGGKCEKVESKECSGGYQCRCSGGYYKYDRSLLENTTCKLGL